MCNQEYEDLTTKMLLSIIAALFLLIPFSYAPASFRCRCW